MATTKTKKTTKRKAVSKAKKTAQIKDENPYTLLMVIVSAIILLILIVPKSNHTHKNPSKKTSLESVELENLKKVSISGKTYNSDAEAYRLLKEIPQTRRTDEETTFVESYQIEY